jgi:hypothetical protein
MSPVFRQYHPCSPTSHETMRAYKRKLRIRRRQSLALRQTLLRPEVNGFFSDRPYWETQHGQKGA